MQRQVKPDERRNTQKKILEQNKGMGNLGNVDKDNLLIQCRCNYYHLKESRTEETTNTDGKENDFDKFEQKY